MLAFIITYKNYKNHFISYPYLCEVIMRTILFAAILFLVMFSCSQFSFSQDLPKGKLMVVRVESADPANSHIRFSAAYAYQNLNASPQFTVTDQETPFELRLSCNHFLGLFQDASHNGKIKVFLTEFSNGIKIADANGSSQLNILHADPSGVGYGWPMTFSDYS